MKLFITAVLLITAKHVIKLMEKIKTMKENGLTAKDSLLFILYSM